MGADRSIPAALSLDGLGGDARGGFDLAAGAGYRGIAFGTDHPELGSRELGESARRHLRTILAGKGLGIDSLRAGVPRGGLADARTIDAAMDQARGAMVLARELGVKTVALNMGRLPVARVAADGEPRAGRGAGAGDRRQEHALSESTLVLALRELAQAADAAGITLALGADSAAGLARITKQVDFEGAKMNLDGAGEIGAAENPLRAAEDYGGLIGQFTAADAVRSGASVRAVMLGEGQLALPELYEILREQGFAGPFVVDVRDLPDKAEAARHAAGVLRRIFMI